MKELKNISLVYLHTNQQNKKSNEIKLNLYYILCKSAKFEPLGTT